MILEHYGLKEPPYSITPDPRFVYLSERHRDALAHLLFGIGQGGGGGFVLLTGEVGTGKTTLSRLLLEQLPPDTRVALVLNPRQGAVELLETICEELHVPIDGARGSVKALVDALNAFLLDAYAQGLRVVLLIDEAQNLPVEALEQVRLLTNLETDTQKLLQVILLGQPELRAMLAREDLRQLSQRITARYHLTPLDAGETAQYLRHRFRIAGGQHFPFTAAAARRLHARAGGVPRLINVIAERALLAGYARDAHTLDARIVELAARETLPAPLPRGRAGWMVAAAAGSVVVLALLLWWWRPAAAPAVDAPAKARPPVAKAMPAPARIARLDASAFARRITASDPSGSDAWQRLTEAWKLPAATTAAATPADCGAVLAPGLLCVRGRGRLDKLLALDRPAALRLRHAGRDAWAVLLGADARDARIALGGDVFDVDRVLLQAHWSGDYTALWRGPEFLASPAAGDGSAAARWIGARVQPSATAGGIAGAVDGAARRDAVRRFQLARGLPADGVAGPETLMALAGDEAGPRLQRVLE
jgi:general secretion pathway protein A